MVGRGVTEQRCLASLAIENDYNRFRLFIKMHLYMAAAAAADMIRSFYCDPYDTDSVTGGTPSGFYGGVVLSMLECSDGARNASNQ